MAEPKDTVVSKPLMDALFRQPPKKAIDYLQQKQVMPSQDWFEVQGNAHNKAFVIAHMTQMDLLQDIKQSLLDAQAKGMNLKDWSAQAEQRMRAKGWWGKKEITTADGTREVQLGSPYRLKTIYQTNMAQAYEAGRQSVMWDDQDTLFPYVMYSAILDNKTRPRHRALHGVVMLKSDPAWQAIAPKNGYNCRCLIIELMQADVTAGGYSVRSSKGFFRIDSVDVNNGGIAQVARLEFPDLPAFATDAGWVGRPTALFMPDLAKYPTEMSRHFVSQLLGDSDVFKSVYRKIEGVVSAEVKALEAQGIKVSKTIVQKDLREKLTPNLVTGTKFPVAVISAAMAEQLGAKTTTVLLSDDTLLKQIINRQNQDIGIAEYNLVQPTLENPILITSDKDYHYSFFQRNERLYVAVIKVTRDGEEIYLQSFREADEKKMQKL